MRRRDSAMKSTDHWFRLTFSLEALLAPTFFAASVNFFVLSVDNHLSEVPVRRMGFAKKSRLWSLEKKSMLVLTKCYSQPFQEVSLQKTNLQEKPTPTCLSQITITLFSSFRMKRAQWLLQRRLLLAWVVAQAVIIGHPLCSTNKMERTTVSLIAYGMLMLQCLQLFYN